MRELAQRQIPLEICPSSNLSTRASAHLAELPCLAHAGVPLCINTDDPAIFRTTLKQEIRQAERAVYPFQLENAASIFGFHAFI